MSGIQTARGQEKLINPLKGYTQDQSSDLMEYLTGQNLGGKKRGLDVVPYGTYSVSTSNSVATGSTQRIIKKTAHNARANDLVQFTSGANVDIIIQILSCPDADTIILAATPENTTSIGDTFDVKRYVPPKYTQDGSIAISGTIVTTPPAQTATFVEDLTVSTTPETFVAPVGAFAAMVYADESNTDYLRVKMGGTASTTSGIQFQPARSEMYEGGSDISYCSESGSGQKISVQWFIR